MITANQAYDISKSKEAIKNAKDEIEKLIREKAACGEFHAKWSTKILTIEVDILYWLKDLGYKVNSDIVYGAKITESGTYVVDNKVLFDIDWNK